MADVSLIDISEGVRQTWALTGSSVTNVIPASKVYFQRAPERVTLPYCVYAFADISGFFGGTEFFSGANYIRKTRIDFDVYALRSTDLSAFATALNDALSWSSTDPNAVWTIPNAVGVLAAMPEVEALEMEEERQDGEDVLKYSTSFTLTIEANRG